MKSTVILPIIRCFSAPFGAKIAPFASQAGRGELREKVIVKKKGCPKDDLPEKPVRSSFFFTTDFAGRRGTAAGHRGRASRHRGRAQIPKIRGPRGSNTQNQGSQGLKYPKTGVPARLWRIFSGNPPAFIRSKIRPNIRKIRNFGSGIRKIRIHPLVGTPACTSEDSRFKEMYSRHRAKA